MAKTQWSSEKRVAPGRRTVSDGRLSMMSNIARTKSSWSNYSSAPSRVARPDKQRVPVQHWNGRLQGTKPRRRWLFRGMAHYEVSLQVSAHLDFETSSIGRE